MLCRTGVCFNFMFVAMMYGVCGSAFAAEAASDDDQAKDGEKVLRHAVFFRFKDSATKADIRHVVDAFRSLPAKIEEIHELESGESIGKSGRSDGLTHCFLLTFKDEAGRAVYLPHEDHKAFGSVLRPHLDEVFVIDYWGRSQKERLKKELKHAVFFKFKDGTSDADVRAVEDGLAELPAKIDVIKAFEWGKNNSPEKHDQGFTHCFMFTFDSEKALKEYADHPAHVEIAQFLLPKMEEIRAIDFWSDRVRKGDGK
jgi:hypothetical protein